MGPSPSLADMVKMAHPRPVNSERETFYGWLLERTVAGDQLPEPVQTYAAFKAALAAGDATFFTGPVAYHERAFRRQPCPSSK